MAKDIIPLVNDEFGNYNVNNDEDVTIMYHNVSPIQTGIPNEYSLSVRPSLGTVVNTASIDDNSRGRGIADFQGYDLMLVNDDTWYYSGGSTAIHAASPFDQEAIAKFTLYSQAGADRLVLVNAGAISEAGTADGSIWFMVDTTTAPTEIADADAPGYNGNSLCRGGVSLDGYFFVGDILGNIVNCDLDDLTAWTSTSLVVAEREADVGIYIGKHRDHVFFLGTRSMEFFYNAANTAPASPLTRRADLFFNIGCYHPNTVLEVGDTTYFIGKTSSGETGLYQLKDFNLEPIGRNPIVDKMIRGLEYAEPDITGATDLQQDCYLASFNSRVNGQFLVLTLPVLGTFALHLATQTWSRWYLGGTPDNNGGIGDWTSPKILPLTASLNRPGASASEPNRFLLLNALVSSETIITGTSQDFIYTGAVLDVTSELGSAISRGFAFGDSGTKVYVGTDAAGTAFVYQYTLTTAFDLSTGTYSSKSFDAFAQATSIFGIHMSTDGTKMFLVSGGDIYSYTLGTAFDIGTSVYDGVSFDLTNEDASNGRGSHFKADGLSFWACGLGNDRIYEYVLTSAYDLTTISYTGNSFGTQAGESIEPEDVSINATGTRMYVVERNGQSLYTYKLSTAFDVTTAVHTTGDIIDISGEASSGEVSWNLAVDNAVFTIDVVDDEIRQYGDLAVDPIEFGGELNGVDNPDWICYTKPWDKDTNERKRVNNIRLLHYPDPRLAVGISNVGIDWINTEDLTAGGLVPASFTGDVNIDINSATARLYRAGMCRQRVYKVTFSGATTQIIKGLEVDYDPVRG